MWCIPLQRIQCIAYIKLHLNERAENIFTGIVLELASVTLVSEMGFIDGCEIDWHCSCYFAGVGNQAVWSL